MGHKRYPGSLRVGWAGTRTAYAPRASVPTPYPAAQVPAPSGNAARGAELSLCVLGGTGDAYLICALVEAFKRHHGRNRVEVVLHSKLEAVAKMFAHVSYRVDDQMVEHAQHNQAFQRSHDNLLLSSPVFYAHPSFMRSGVRVDQLTARPDVSQASMYRAMLQLPADAPLSRPRVPHARKMPDTVLLIDEAVSWANTQPTFWSALAEALVATGRTIVRNNRSWPLQQLFEMAAAVEWVIGPQCGVMSIIVAGGFPCRKTVASPSMDYNTLPDQWMDHTYPYGYVTKFDGEDYDVEEFKITDDNHAEVVSSITGGVNALRLRPHNPAPTLSVMMPLTPGDFLDRLAILEVKRSRFGATKRAAIEREYKRYAEALFRLRASNKLDSATEDLFGQLIALHRKSFELLSEVVPSGKRLAGPVDAPHAKVIELNCERVRLKNLIDSRCHAPYAEVKDYSGAS